MLNVSRGFDKKKLKDVKEWFTPENRTKRMKKVMEYLVNRGEPTWFNISEIFTPEELEQYKTMKTKKEQKKVTNKKSSTASSLPKVDITKPWSEDNNYEEITWILEAVMNDDYTVTAHFRDGTVKIYDLKDKIFNKNNREYKWFKRLQDIREFKKGIGIGWILRWDNDTDISSYELYVNGK